MASALDGITVLELSQTPAGAMAGMFLSDHGARVTRLLDSHEQALRPGGYRVWDRGKACRRLDLSQATAGPQASGYEGLLRGADIVLEDLPPSSDRQDLVRSEWLAAPQSAPDSLLHHRLWEARPTQGRAGGRRAGHGPYGHPGNHAGLPPRAGARGASTAQRGGGAVCVHRHGGGPSCEGEDGQGTDR